MEIPTTISSLGHNIIWDRSDISNLIGAISLAFWLCNGIPLVYEIYKRKSADGVSLGFVCLWAIGDVLNLAGSIWAQLVPTTIFVAIYYIFSDAVILSEAFYFRTIAPTKGAMRVDNDEETPLIEAPAELFIETEHRSTITSEILYNVGACVGVSLLGCLGWWLGTLLVKDDISIPSDPEKGDSVLLGPQILGYSSAMLYLCARIPQIMKNYRKKKTDGLALLFFIFSVFGNLSYAASIVAYSSDPEYLITNISWLLGSLGTLAFDFVILFQFLLYRHRLHDVEADPEASLLNT